MYEKTFGFGFMQERSRQKSPHCYRGVRGRADLLLFHLPYTARGDCRRVLDCAWDMAVAELIFAGGMYL
jgi:hypothetical protein